MDNKSHEHLIFSHFDVGTENIGQKEWNINAQGWEMGANKAPREIGPIHPKKQPKS